MGFEVDKQKKKRYKTNMVKRPKNKVEPQIGAENLVSLEERKPLPVSRANPKIDADKAISMRLKGCTLNEIAGYFGVSEQAVSERLGRVMPDYGEIDGETFRRQKADILSYSQAALLKSLTAAKIKDMGGRDTIVSLGILHDKEADLRGTSPAMAEVAAISSLVDALKGYKSPVIEAECEEIPSQSIPGNPLTP